MHGPKFSIVIDNYNYGRFLRQSLESCLQQTRLPHEIIVVDDGSTDHSREILADFENHPLIRVIYQENSGQEAALQRGFDLSTGDWILGLDSDDFYLPDCLEQLAQHVGGDVSWIYFRAKVIDDNGKHSGYRPRSPKPLLQGNLAERWLCRQERPTMSPQSFHCFSQSFIKSITIFPNPGVNLKRARPADVYMWIMAAFHGRAVGVERVLGVYRDHGAGASKISDTLEHFRTNMEAVNFRQDLIAKKLREHSYPVPALPHYFRSESYWGFRLVSLAGDPEKHSYPDDTLSAVFSRLVPLIWAEKQEKWDFRLFKILKSILILIFPSSAVAIWKLRPRRDLRQIFRSVKEIRP